MGEAARRKQQGFDGRKLGEEVLAALNADAGGKVWELVKGSEYPEHFLVLGAEEPTVTAGLITNREAEETPHRLVAQTLFRRGEPWISALIFDPVEEYRQDVYLQLARSAVGAVHGKTDQSINRVEQRIIHSVWPELPENVLRASVDPGPDAGPPENPASA